MYTKDDNLSSREARRLARDVKTVVVMAQLYCRTNHRGLQQENGLCEECSALVRYAQERTMRCPHEHKGTCENCDIQCYKPAMRQGIRRIMAYSGPRMIIHHPVLAVRHVVKKLTYSDKQKS